MLSIFRTNQVFVSFLLLFYGGLLFSGVLVFPAAAEAGPHGFLQHWVIAWLPNTPLVLFIAIVVLLFLQAFMLNLMEYNYRLDRELHMFPGVFFMLFSAMVPGPDALLPVFLANIFLFLAIYEVMGTFKQNQAAGNLFNAGLFLGVACLFYPSYAVFLLALFSGLNILRGFQFMERIMVLAGVVVAYYLTGTTAFLTGHWNLFTDLQGLNAYGFLDLQPGTSIPYSLLPWAVFLVILVFQHPLFMQKRVIQTQKRITIWYWVMLMSVATLLIQKHLAIWHVHVLALPVSYLTAMLVSRMRPNWAELLHILLFFAALYVQFEPWIFKNFL
ncbi:MAG: hypothetical protein KBC60_12150 [Haliscomenobacter sp.]|nr:hypothetical protein [Haliscomenobacter sp.]